MLHLSNFLLPKSILLSLSAEEKEPALEEVMQLLQNDDRVSQWKELRQSILDRPAFPLAANERTAIIIYHGRTNSVQDLLLAVGRSEKGIRFAETEQTVHLIFIAAIPHALSNEYLRAMGSIARACKDATTLEKLLSTKSPQEFIEILSQESEA